MNLSDLILALTKDGFRITFFRHPGVRDAIAIDLECEGVPKHCMELSRSEYARSNLDVLALQIDRTAQLMKADRAAEK